MEGYNFYPKRTECLYQITNHYRVENKHIMAYNFYKLGKAIPFPENDVLFIHKNMYHTLFDYELTIIAFSLMRLNMFDIKDIYPVYKNLLNQTPDVFQNEYYQSMICNYKVYAPKIQDIQKHELNISSKLNEEFISSTPSIVQHNGKFLLNLRFVNYRIDNKGNYVNQKQITTFNECCLLEPDFSCAGRKMFEEKEVPSLYRGIEDIRLFSHDDKIYYSGVIQNTDIKDKLQMTVSIGEYKINEKYLEQINLESPVGADCEKNWVLFNHENTLKVIYKWQNTVKLT